MEYRWSDIFGTLGDPEALGRDIPRQGRDTPRQGRDTPRQGPDTPWQGRDTPRQGRDTPGPCSSPRALAHRPGACNPRTPGGGVTLGLPPLKSSSLYGHGGRGPEKVVVSMAIPPEGHPHQAHSPQPCVLRVGRDGRSGGRRGCTFRAAAGLGGGACRKVRQSRSRWIRVAPHPAPDHAGAGQPTLSLSSQGCGYSVG
eukprot:gene24283-biopygen20886